MAQFWTWAFFWKLEQTSCSSSDRYRVPFRLQLEVIFGVVAFNVDTAQKRLKFLKSIQNILKMWQLPAILTITNATLFTIYLRMWAVFQHRGVWSNGHRGCHTAICIRITLNASCIRPITKNVTEATSLAFERGSCVKKYTISLSIELL